MMKTLLIALGTVLVILVGSVGAVLLFSPSTIEGRHVIITEASYSTSSSSVHLKVKVQTDQTFSVTTTTASAFQVEVLQPGYSVLVLAGQVITNHTFSAGTTTYDVGGMLAGPSGSDPSHFPDFLYLRVHLGDNKLLSSEPYRLYLS